MSVRNLALLILAAWISLTLGVYLLTHSLAVFPILLGLALAVLAYVYGRDLFVSEVRK